MLQFQKCARDLFRKKKKFQENVKCKISYMKYTTKKNVFNMKSLFWSQSNKVLRKMSKSEKHPNKHNMSTKVVKTIIGIGFQNFLLNMVSVWMYFTFLWYFLGQNYKFFPSCFFFYWYSKHASIICTADFTNRPTSVN